MKNLPVSVKDEDIEEMFEFADKDKDGNLSYEEFLVRLGSHFVQLGSQAEH